MAVQRLLRSGAVPRGGTLKGVSGSPAAASNALTFADAFAAYLEIHSPAWKPKTAALWAAFRLNPCTA